MPPTEDRGLQDVRWLDQVPGMFYVYNTWCPTTFLIDYLIIFRLIGIAYSAALWLGNQLQKTFISYSGPYIYNSLRLPGFSYV